MGAPNSQLQINQEKNINKKNIYLCVQVWKIVRTNKIYNNTAIGKPTGGTMKKGFTVRSHGEMGKKSFVLREMKSISSVSKGIPETNNGIEASLSGLKKVQY